MQEHERIGQYEVVGQIGKGGMATVYKAYHDRLDRHVAIKLMHTSLIQDDSFIARFQREAKIVAKLDHSNIVPIYDYSELDGNPYLVMKYIEGMTLKQRALKTGLTISEVIGLLIPLADALDYAHRMGVLHRDLKPSNILIDPQGKPYITDFGLARMAQIGESTISHDMMLGTPFYISPEQAQGAKDLTKSTDIYSFGIILYELITGTVPFYADSAYAIVHGHIYKEVPSASQTNPKLPRAVDDVMNVALAKNPAGRYETASEMVQAFARAMSADAPSPVQSQVASSETQPRFETRTPDESPQVIMPAMPSMPVMPPMPSIESPKGRKVTVEASFDLGKTDWKQVEQRVGEWGTKIGEWGERMGERAEKWGSSLEARFNEDGDDAVTARARKRVKKRMEERNSWLSHLAAYIIANCMLWAFFLITTDSFPVWMIFVTGGWGIGVVSHSMEYYTKYGGGAERREAEIQREVERELELSGVKSKNKEKRSGLSLDDLDTQDSPSVRLTDEGELTDSFVEETEEIRKRSYR
jgi:serine/threonine protein kinase